MGGYETPDHRVPIKESAHKAMYQRPAFALEDAVIESDNRRFAISRTTGDLRDNPRQCTLSVSSGILADV